MLSGLEGDTGQAAAIRLEQSPGHLRDAQASALTPVPVRKERGDIAMSNVGQGDEGGLEQGRGLVLPGVGAPSSLAGGSGGRRRGHAWKTKQAACVIVLCVV